MDTQKYTIGQMSELCDISKKQLRYYDEIGLLTPEYRSEETNYRYYSYSQIEEVLLIKELRRLDVPLKNIARLFGNRNIFQIQEMLKDHLAALRAEIEKNQKKYDETVDLLIRIMSSSSFCTTHPQNTISLVHVDPMQVCFTRKISPCNATQSFIYRRAQLMTLCDSLGILTKGPNYAIFHSDCLSQFADSEEDILADLEVFYETEKPTPLPGCESCVRTIPAFDAVSCIHFGHYKYMLPSYQAMIAWAEQRDLELTDASMEKYIVGATNTDNSEEYVTKIFIPLKGCSFQ